MKTFPSISVIIPTHNERFHIGECLESLCNQDYPDFEIVVVDNGSTDDTRRICQGFPKVTYIYYDRRKSSYAARNEGVRHSRGEVVAFFDADQVALPHYLATLVDEYVPGDPNHIYCGRLADDPRVPRVLQGLQVCDVLLQDVKAGHIGTGFSAVPRQLFDELGGFNDDVLAGGDFEFFGRAVGRAKVHICQRIGAYHYWASSLDEVLVREERYGFGKCLRARAEGRRPPSFVAAAARVGWVAMLKLGSAVLVPARYPNREWTERWLRQFFHCRTVMRHAVGILKFKLGYKRAGDLPA